jgi:hypothetical protein
MSDSHHCASIIDEALRGLAENQKSPHRGSDQDGAFGIVASGPGLLKKKSRIDQVATGHRPFPARGATPEQWKSSQKMISLAEYVQRISRRMYALGELSPLHGSCRVF